MIFITRIVRSFTELEWGNHDQGGLDFPVPPHSLFLGGQMSIHFRTASVRKSRKPKAARSPAASPCIAEPLEARQLMTITVASITGTGTVVEGSTYTANLSATSSGGPSAITGWTINWGDGNGPQNYPCDPAAATHVYANDAGSPRTITGTVSDNISMGGSFTTSSLTTTSNITVTEAAPTFLAWVPGTNFEGDTVSLSHSFVDPGGDTITGYSIDWNDGTVNSSFTHTYAEESSSQGYRIGVTATTTDGGTYSTVTSFAHAHIGDYALTSASSTTINVVEGGTFTAVVGHFTDANMNATASDYATPTVNWGDSTTSTGSIVANPNGGWDVMGTHAYAAAGLFNASAVITDVGGASATVGNTFAPKIIDLTAKPITATITPPTPVEIDVYDANGVDVSTENFKISKVTPPNGGNAGDMTIASQAPLGTGKRQINLSLAGSAHDGDWVVVLTLANPNGRVIQSASVTITK